MRRVVLLMLAACGAATLFATVLVTGWIAYEAYRERAPRQQDLAYIVNWAELGGSVRIAEIVHSHVSGRSFTGDHADAYCLRLNTEGLDFGHQHGDKPVWLRGPIEDPILVDAITTAALFTSGGEAPWFPEPPLLNSGRFVLSFPKVTARWGNVNEVAMTAYDTKEHLLYHSDVKW